MIFINLFLNKGPFMSLEEAAENIFEEDDDGQRIFKSKVSMIMMFNLFSRAADSMTLQTYLSHWG